MKTTILSTTTTKNRTKIKFTFARSITGQLLNWASMNRPTWRHRCVLIGLSLASFALSPQTRAACQEGCLTNDNTVLGDDALLRNTAGSRNTAIGGRALFSNTLGAFNTAIGFGTLYNNTAGNIEGGIHNTAIGLDALYSNITGETNTAIGSGALVSNTGGSGNTASGFHALYSNTTGEINTANGLSALVSNTTGDNNTASGFQALYNNTTGSFNIAFGVNAGFNLTTGGNNIDIGNVGVAGESNTIRIGTKLTHKATFIAGISGVAVPTGVAVIIDANGHLGTVVSSERFKDAIKPMAKASEAILALKPVTFRYNHELDPNGIPQFGLVAEQVEKVNPDLVARDDQGRPYSVRYEAVNAMLLNEFLKQHYTVEEQKASIDRLQAIVAQQEDEFRAAIAQQRQKMEAVVTSLKDQAAQIQRVSVQIEAREQFPQLAVNEQ